VRECATPFIGDEVVLWLRGDYAIGDATLNRFFVLHFLFPFIIFAMVFMHLVALHYVKSSNPTGIDLPKSAQIPFHPYYTIKDLYGLGLFLIAKAREGGPAYVYTLLTSFYTTPEGRVDNRLFPGIKMPDALGSSSPGNQAAVDRTAREVALFLAWAADPRAEERHRLGRYVLAYLVLLTFLLYLNKRRVWQRLPADNPEIDPASTKASP